MLFVSLSMSSSGQYIGIIDFTFGFYLSTNYGVSFNLINMPDASTNVGDVNMSSSGKYMFVTTSIPKGSTTQTWYYSSNYGTSFTASSAFKWTTPRFSFNEKYCLSYDTNANIVYLSSNYGASFSPTTVSLSVNAFGYQLSSTGQYMVCVGATTIIVSTDYGSTWTTSLDISSLQAGIHFNVRDNQIYISSDGNYMIAYAGNYTFVGKLSAGTYTWNNLLLSNTALRSTYMSSSGKYMTSNATANSTNLYYSTNYGVTWNPSNVSNPSNMWGGSKISQNGKYVVAYDFSSNIYISSDSGANFSFSYTNSNFVNNNSLGGPATQATVFGISDDGKYIALIVREVDKYTYLYLATGT